MDVSCLRGGVGAKVTRIIQGGSFMLLVTGGAGFIGSNIVAALNEAGRADVAVCDFLGSDGKWRNLAKRQLADIVPPAELMSWLNGRKLDAVIHMGAISETTATDGDLVIETNFRLDAAARLVHGQFSAFHLRLVGCDLWRWRSGFSRRRVACGAQAAPPDESLRLEQASVRPRADGARAKGEKMPPQWAGLKFFNVFGPNEYHKGSMMSVLAAFRRHPRRPRRAALQVASRRYRRRRPAPRFHPCR
jgi:ADP-L-glycero-D-manno-heptose 6-epimerase